MATLADIERTGLTDAEWDSRKRHYRLSGLKSGDWHSIRPDNLDIKHLRPGMMIENKTHKTRYIIVRTDGRTDDRFQRPCIQVIAPEHQYYDYNVRKLFYKDIKDLSRFKLIIQ